MAKVQNFKFTAEELQVKISQLSENINKLGAVGGFEDMVEQMESERASYQAALDSLAGVDKAEVFNKLFANVRLFNEEGENVTELTEEQFKFIGDGIVLKVNEVEGKLVLALAKKAGSTGTGSGTAKAQTPYVKYTFEGIEYEKAKEAVDAAVEFLKFNGTVIKVSDGNSMRREIVALNKKYKLDVQVLLRDGNTIDLIDSPFETEAKAIVETPAAEATSAE